MAIKFSLTDVLGAKVASAIRRVADRKIEVTGSTTSVLRIITSAPPKETQTNWFDSGESDVLGNSVSGVQTEIIDNVVISYPFSNIELAERLNQGQYVANPVEALDLFEFLPIIMKVKFYGAYEQKAVQLQKGDLIVDIIKNDTGQFLPVMLEVMRLRGDLKWKQIVGRGYELSLHRGTLADEIQSTVDAYIGEYEAEWVKQFGTVKTTSCD